MAEIYVKRYIKVGVKDDPARKMVFISDSRQSSKTTLSVQLLQAEFGNMVNRFYLSWDSAADREKIIREQFPAGRGMLVLDEIHKYGRWRQVVKGLYDKRKTELKIIVTGSGRLDYYRRGGESLQGRYHFYRLYPFSLREINEGGENRLSDLLKYGGFPEPFLSASERETRRWSREYRTRVIYDDLSTLENLRDISLLEQLSLRLPDLVGSPLSANALREDLQISHQTVMRWLDMLENVYLIFRVYPFGTPEIKALKKSAKHYHFDWTLVEDEGARFENLIAVHLLKWVHFKQDYEGLSSELRYFRNKEGKEVDFVVLENREPVLFVEAKLKNRQVNPALRYLKKRFPKARAVQVALHQEDDLVNKHGIRLCPASTFLMELI